MNQVESKIPSLAAVCTILLLCGVVLGAVPAAIGQPRSATPRKEPGGVLTLPDALALALMENPELAPFPLQQRANEARVLQAGRRVNPELSLQVEDVLGTGIYDGGSQAQTTLQLSQVIEFGGKRSSRTEVAELERDIIQSEYELKRVDVLADVTQRFIRVVASQHLLELALTNNQVAVEALQSVRTRVQAGKASALEERKAEVALARGTALVEAARHELNAARKILTASWGNPEPVFERAEADLFAREPVPPMADLVASISSSPELARWVSVQKLRSAEVKLADARRSPNIMLSGGIRHLEGSGDDAFVFGLSLPLQIFDRNQGGKAEARALVDLNQAEREAAEFRLGVVLLGLYEDMVYYGNVMEGLEKVILPGAEEALTISREGYVQGRFSYLDVLDAQRTIFDVRNEYIQSGTSYHQFLVEIERLTGQPFEGGTPQQ